MESKKNHIIITCCIALCMCFLTLGCNNGSTTNGEFAGDTVEVKMVKLSDTSSFKKSNGELCSIIVDATVAVPVHFKDKSSTESLRKLFVKYILFCSDSLSMDEALATRMNNVVHQYDFADAPSVEDIEEDNCMEDINSYINNTKLSIYYNKNNIVTFCKVEVVKKDDVVTSVTHRYYSFDLEKMAYIDFNSMFREDALSSICNDMRSYIMSSNKVLSNDQLNEIGYYNIDNMTVSRHFYFGTDGITWSYLPNELAVEALGEPTVTLKYEELERYMTDNSVLKRLY